VSILTTLTTTAKRRQRKEQTHELLKINFSMNTYLCSSDVYPIGAVRQRIREQFH
jgi:hypothetical protein